LLLEDDENQDILEKDYTLIDVKTELYNFRTGIIKMQKDLDYIVKILDEI